MQVCKSGITNARKIWLTRHGESQYNQAALIGGDSLLSTTGEQYAHYLPEVLISRMPKVGRMSKSMLNVLPVVLDAGLAAALCITISIYMSNIQQHPAAKQTLDQCHARPTATSLPGLAVSADVAPLPPILTPPLTRLSTPTHEI